MAKVKLLASDAEVEAWFRTQPGSGRASLMVADEIAHEAALNAAETRFYSGHYAASFRTRLTGFGGAEVFNDDRKARWIELGTGIYGPKHQPITAKPRTVVVRASSRRTPKGNRARVRSYSYRSSLLVFRPYGATNAFPTAPTQDLAGLVYAHSVKGQPATHNLTRAAKTVAARSSSLRYSPGRLLR